MKAVHYGIINVENRWKIVSKGLPFGSYATKAEAEKVAKRIADHIADLLPVRLHLDDHDGSRRLG